MSREPDWDEAYQQHYENCLDDGMTPEEAEAEAQDRLEADQEAWASCEMDAIDDAREADFGNRFDEP